MRDYFKTPSGNIIDNDLMLWSWADVANFSDESGWFQFWGDNKLGHESLIIDHVWIGYSLPGSDSYYRHIEGDLIHRTSCQSKEEFERYLKLIAFQ